MIAVADSEEALLERFWQELRVDPRLAHLMALVPTDRALGVMDFVTLVPAILAGLGGPRDQVQLLDALAHAYARAAGLHFVEE